MPVPIAVRPPAALAARFGLPAAAVLAGLAAFAAAGVSIHAMWPLAVAFPVVAARALVASTTSARASLAVALAFSATSLGIAWNHERFDLRDLQQYGAWLAEHGASRDGYDTLVVTGFPIQAIDGHGGGGAPERLWVGKGLGALLANFAVWFAVFVAASRSLPRRAVVPAAWAAVALAPVTGCVAFSDLMALLD